MKIVIDGNIGCGKTTVIKKLNDDIRIPIFLEPLHKWNEHLKLFYEDPHKWAFPFNLEVLTSFHEWKNNTFPAIYERSPMACRYVFTQLNHELGHMHKLELNTFHKIYKELEWKPDIMIYIRTSPKTCIERIKERGRNCETGVSDDYINAINEKYESLIEDMKKHNIAVYVIDGNQQKQEVFKQIKDLFVTLGFFEV